MSITLSQHCYNGESTSKKLHVHSQHDFHSNQSQNKVEKSLYSFEDILFAHSSLNQHLKEMGVSKCVVGITLLDGCRIHLTNKHCEAIYFVFLSRMDLYLKEEIKFTKVFTPV